MPTPTPQSDIARQRSPVDRSARTSTPSREDGETVRLPRAASPSTVGSKSKQVGGTPTTGLSNANESNRVAVTLPPISNNSHRASIPQVPNALASNGNGSIAKTSKLSFYGPNYNSTFPYKLTVLQVAALLKPFWADLLQNQIKQVRKHLVENHLKKIDFNSPAVRYAPNADASPVHLCAQYGLLPMAKMLVHEFGLAFTLRNKVGSTPLHVACKFAKVEFVSWLIDELQVPLDVPDVQHRIAFDVASYGTVDQCVLLPLRSQLLSLQQQEQELVQANEAAKENLTEAELVFRQKSMILCDTESCVQEAQARIVAISALEKSWHEEWEARNAELDDLVLQYETQREKLALEEQRARDIYERDVKIVEEQLAEAQSELNRLEVLVATTQQELDRRNQLLVDQLGVFDASLGEFRGCKQVQEWAVGSLMAIASDNLVDSPVAVTKEELLLRAEPVQVVNHILATFPLDYSLQLEAIQLLMAVLHLHESVAAIYPSGSEQLVCAVADSNLILQLGDSIVRWFTQEENAILVHCTLEALYLCLRLRRNVQRMLSLCQNRELQVRAARLLEIGASVIGTTAASLKELRHTAQLVLTMARYGVKTALIQGGIIRTAFRIMKSFSLVETGAPPAMHIEVIQYIIATLVLLIPDPGGSEYSPKQRQPLCLEDLTRDTDSIGGATVIQCLNHCVSPFPEPNAIIVIDWAFQLLLNIAQHGGDTALRVRSELLGEGALPTDAFFDVLRAIRSMQSVGASAAGCRAVQSGLNLVQCVWVERFNHEGQILPTHVDVLKSLVEITTVHTEHVLVDSRQDSVDAIQDVTGVVKSLTRAAENRENSKEIYRYDGTLGRGILKPILDWVLRFLDERRASFDEPRLARLLVSLLKFFVHIVRARKSEERTLSDQEVMAMQRDLHARSRDLGICAVLKIFTHATDSQTPDSDHHREWTSLRAISMLVDNEIHCTC